VSEQLSSDVQLPEATAAGLVLEEAEAKIVFLNIDKNGSLRSYPGTSYDPGGSEDEDTRGGRSKTTSRKIAGLLEKTTAISRSRTRGQAAGDKMVLVIRAHKDCPVNQVDLVLRMAQNSGYRNFKPACIETALIVFQFSVFRPECPSETLL